MKRTLMRAKIHRATVTGADLHYEGSISIDPRLCDAANIVPYERVEIYNVNNGQRFATYAIYGEKNQICLNGAAARLAHKGDLIIIAAYGTFDDDESVNFKPRKVFVDSNNNISG